MNKPDIDTQRAILQNSIRQLEAEAYNHQVTGEAFNACGFPEDGRKHAELLAKSLKLHAHFTTKLAELL